MSGEPLTPVPGSTTPGNVSYNYTSSKVRIEEPVAKPGEVLEIRQTNPIDFSVIATTDMNYLKILSPAGNMVRAKFLPLTLSGNIKSYNGLVLLDNAFQETKFEVEVYQQANASSVKGGRDFLNVFYFPPPKKATFYIPLYLISTSLQGAKIGPNQPVLEIPGFGKFLDFSKVIDTIPSIDTQFFEFIINDFYIEFTNVDFYYVPDSTKLGGGRIDFSVQLKVHINSGEVDYGVVQCNLAGTEPITGINISGSLSLSLPAIEMETIYAPTKTISFFKFPYPHFIMSNFSASVNSVNFKCISGTIDEAIKNALNSALRSISDSEMTSVINPELPHTILNNTLFKITLPDTNQEIFTYPTGILDTGISGIGGCSYATDFATYGYSIKAHYQYLEDIPFVTVNNGELSLWAPYFVNLTNSSSGSFFMEMWFQDCM